jgi:hypothetical protein
MKLRVEHHLRKLYKGSYEAPQNCAYAVVYRGASRVYLHKCRSKEQALDFDALCSLIETWSSPLFPFVPSKAAAIKALSAVEHTTVQSD